ncbi:MAG: methyltransferase domain-containing protein [Candidatus Muiribacteriota bacterium]
MRTAFFKKFLNFFWLRPENALLLALRAEQYQSTLSLFGNGKKSIDVSCGDGVFSFITLGGALSELTDMFRSLDLTKKRGAGFDAFDSFDDEFLIEVEEPPKLKYEYGTDWKKNLLLKAKKLNFYNQLLHHDNNNSLPFPDESMEYVYSNSSYWVQNFEEHLLDLSRITTKKGHIILEIKTSEIMEFCSNKYAPFMGNKFHNIINAGRVETWKGLRSKDEILKIIDSIPNTQVISVYPIYGNIMAKIWDIGLRPIFYPLYRMSEKLTNEERVSVKREWCQIFEELFYDFLKQYECEEHDAIEFCVVIEKK